MSAAGPQLHDIRLPQVPWWPPAIGWWMLAGMAMLACVVGVAIWWCGRRARAWRRAAHDELATLAARHARDRDDAALAAGLSRLLRRIALLLKPEAAARGDAAWRAFLTEAGRANVGFSEGQLDTLATAPFRAHVSFDAAALLDATHRWCDSALRRRARQGGSR
ncbi:MAG TPA: DUF4381 domain-containing protein [Rhodanobacteraceae bacterium]|nr:DUF4381 domain-containing protein [Rhodanobacteraceae bacterium]